MLTRSTLRIIVLLITLAISHINGYNYHGVEIIKRPDDVVDSSCGEKVSIECVAKAMEQKILLNKVVTEQLQVPDIEWWFRDHSNSEEAKKLSTMNENGKFEIQKEVFFVVRSTLVIKNVNSADEGVYQCRASMSPERHANDVNLYQHWRIEEAPVKDPDCQDKNATSQLQVEKEMINDFLEAVEAKDEPKDTVLSRLIQSLTGNEEDTEYDVVDVPVDTTTSTTTTKVAKTMKNRREKVATTTTKEKIVKTSLPTAKSQSTIQRNGAELSVDIISDGEINDEEVLRQQDPRNTGSTSKIVIHWILFAMLLHAFTWALHL